MCVAGEKCQNQAFTKREYTPVDIFRTLSRGWGLRSVSDIKKVCYEMHASHWKILLCVHPYAFIYKTFVIVCLHRVPL